MDSEELKEFERQVLAGEINDFNTDFKYYFEQAEDEDDIRDMQRICIENNVYKKAYRDWADELVRSSYNAFVPQENNTELQFLLINNNHCLDILIYSDNKEVRQAVIERDIEYAFKNCIMEYDQDIVMENLMNAIEPHAELLDTFLECNDGSWDLRALELKQKARSIVPTIIEKTMTPYQLYTSGSPLWTSELTAEEADAILKHTVGTCTLTEEEFNNRYQKALDGELTKKPFHLVMGW